MKPVGMRIVGAALFMMLGIWAGTRVYSLRHAQNHRAGSLPVPVGEASPPNPSDIQGSDFASAGGDSISAGGDIALAGSPVPNQLPQFSLNNLQGKPTSSVTWAGKSVVLNFWATWCAPCRREMPLLKTLAGEWAGRQVAVIGVAVDYPDKVREFASQFKIDYPLLVGEEDALDVAAKLGMQSPAFPFTVFTDRRGQVVALFVGELHREQADLILSVVENLNRDQVQLPEARRSIAEGLGKLAEKAAG
jgi:thiol-disulfide isomerase/thioredoxin